MLSSALSGHWPYLVGDVSQRATSMTETAGSSQCAGLQNETTSDFDEAKVLAQHLLEVEARPPASSGYTLPILFEHLDLLADGLSRKVPGISMGELNKRSKRFVD
jgi:hypothetical protein